MIDFNRPVARSGFGGGGAFPAKVDLFTRFLTESGIFLAYFGKKWMFSRAFFGEGGLFCVFTACQGHVLWSNFENMFENYALRDFMI